MEIYHVLNRGVDKRKVFLEDVDYLRCINDLYVFNDEAYVDPNFGRDVSKDRFFGKHKRKKPLVNIHTFCLMPNHYHLLLSELREGGIAKFMQKLNKGYARYFNEKYKRTGSLWQGKYKKILIKKDGHFLHVPYYIHLNPLDLCAPEWREGKVHNTNEALTFLKTYRWSSHLDYAGVKNFPSITERGLLSGEGVLGLPKQYITGVKHMLAKNVDMVNIGKNLE